ncbi:MAG: hypothetical protein FWD83_10510 [Promicromonosporaceae bacterium]|nr:hypothetical protein [Promicromonosporaceae bacterium]
MPSPDVIRRRRKRVAVILGVFVLIVAGLTAFWRPGFAFPAPIDGDLDAVITPTPAIRAGERTALVEAVPDLVGDLAQQRIDNYPAWQADAGAVESWAFTFSDWIEAQQQTPDAAEEIDPDHPVATDSNPQDDAILVIATIGQWPDVAATVIFFEEQLALLDRPVNSGEVEVGSRVTGNFILTGTREEGELWWRNGTVVVRAHGPRRALEAFYATFPF